MRYKREEETTRTPGLNIKQIIVFFTDSREISCSLDRETEMCAKNTIFRVSERVLLFNDIV